MGAFNNFSGLRKAILMSCKSQVTLMSHGLIYLLQVAHARLNKQGHRPLGRTQSAPLPLGHPMLAGTSIALVPTHYEEYLPEKQVYDQQQAHNFLKQVIVIIDN